MAQYYNPVFASVLSSIARITTCCLVLQLRNLLTMYLVHNRQQLQTRHHLVLLQHHRCPYH